MTTTTKAGAAMAESPFTEAQVTALLSAISPKRVLMREGKRNVEAYDIRATLIKAFGFGGWSGEVIDTTLTYETLYTKPAYDYVDKRTHEKKHVEESERVSVAYRVRYRLTIYVWQRTPVGLERQEVAVYAEEAMGDAAGFPVSSRMGAHDFALKTAESQALKRAAINLGDQFGLSLYSKDGVWKVVHSTMAGMPTGKSVAEAAKDFAENVNQVYAEVTRETPDAERSWLDQALAIAGDADAIGLLYGEARAAKVSNMTLEAIKRFAAAPEDGAAE